MDTLEPGKLADVIIVDGNPLEEIEISDGLVAFKYRPFEIVTIRLA